MPRRFTPIAILAFLAAGALSVHGPRADERPSAWPVLVQPFESTGGGGIMIAGYDPRIADGTCRTDFTATTPSGDVFRNEVVFDAVAIDGGILCRNGRWRAKDGSAEGTTPFVLFVRDGVLRSPAR